MLSKCGSDIGALRNRGKYEQYDSVVGGPDHLTACKKGSSSFNFMLKRVSRYLHSLRSRSAHFPLQSSSDYFFAHNIISHFSTGRKQRQNRATADDFLILVAGKLSIA